MLSDEDKRKWYNQGGILLVKNMETALKEVEGQEAQAMAQLDMQVCNSAACCNVHSAAQSTIRGTGDGVALP